MTNFFGRRRSLRSAKWASIGLRMDYRPGAELVPEMPFYG